MMEDLRSIVEEELEDTLLERVGMQDAVDGAKDFVFKTKKLLAEEKNRRRAARAQVSLSNQRSMVSCRLMESTGLHSLEGHSQGMGVEN
jgi:hypothetical protein